MYIENPRMFAKVMEIGFLYPVSDRIAGIQHLAVYFAVVFMTLTVHRVRMAFISWKPDRIYSGRLQPCSLL